MVMVKDTATIVTATTGTMMMMIGPMKPSLELVVFDCGVCVGVPVGRYITPCL